MPLEVKMLVIDIAGNSSEFPYLIAIGCYQANKIDEVSACFIIVPSTFIAHLEFPYTSSGY